MNALSSLASAQDAELLQTLIAEVTGILGDVQIVESSTLGELGVDSVNIAELILVCEKVYGRSVDPETLFITYNTSLLDLHEVFATAAGIARIDTGG